jgi:hypothetical protein
MKRREAQEHLIEDVRAKQQNVLWPQAMVNSTSVDALLWKGSPNASKVQRIGIGIWGLAFLCVGAVFELGAYEKDELFPAFFGLPCLALGAKIFLNAFKRNSKRVTAKEH